ncbi:hypothetical protein, partial [Dietzia psychralcaliphila]
MTDGQRWIRIEEELHLVDLRTRRPVRRAPEVLASADEQGGGPAGDTAGGPAGDTVFGPAGGPAGETAVGHVVAAR